MDDNGDSPRPVLGLIHRSTTRNGHEIRTVSLAHHLTVSMALLGVAASLGTYILGGRNAEKAIIDQFRLEVREAKTEMSTNLEREKGVAQATHDGLHKRIDALAYDVRSLNNQFIDHVARGR